jgi:Tat protein translocase TatB subunit
MFGTLGGPELFLILVVALIVFGPRKLPDIGKSLGRMMAEFRKASNEFKRTIENEVEADKIRESMKIELPRIDETTSREPPTKPRPDTTATEPAPATLENPPEPVAAVSPDPGATLRDPK